MDKAELDVAEGLSIKAVERHKNKITNVSQPEKVQVPKAAKHIFGRAAHISGLPIYCIYVLVNLHILSPLLSREEDWAILEHVFSRLARSKKFLKAIIKRFPVKERQEIIDHCDEGEIESFIRRQLETDPGIKRARLYSLLIKRFTRINWNNCDDQGKTFKQRCGALIRMHRDRIKAKIRYANRVVKLDKKEAEYYEFQLYLAIDNVETILASDLECSNRREKLSSGMLEISKKYIPNQTKTLAGFQLLFSMLGINLPDRRKDYLLWLDRLLVEFSEKLPEAKKLELITCRMSLQEMTASEQFELINRIDFYYRVLNLDSRLHKISIDSNFSEKDRNDARAMLEGIINVSLEEYQAIDNWLFNKEEMFPNNDIEPDEWDDQNH